MTSRWFTMPMNYILFNLALLQVSGCNMGKIPNLIPTMFRSSINESEIVSPGFYLNLNSSAQCSGVITSWKGCYYLKQGTADHANGPIELSVGVWRPGVDMYQLVGDNLTKLTIPSSPASYTLVCQVWNLPCEQRLSVKQGDVIGLHLSSNETRFKVLQSIEGSSVYYQASLGDGSMLNNEFTEEGYDLNIQAMIGTFTLTGP